jgi:excisionase family DNA binding protein
MDIEKSATPSRHRKPSTTPNREMPSFLTVAEVADLLRTTKTAIYATIGRAQLPGVIRLGRRVLVRSDELLDWLRQKSAPSPER